MPRTYCLEDRVDEVAVQIFYIAPHLYDQREARPCICPGVCIAIIAALVEVGLTVHFSTPKEIVACQVYNAATSIAVSTRRRKERVPFERGFCEAQKSTRLIYSPIWRQEADSNREFRPL